MRIEDLGAGVREVVADMDSCDVGQLLKPLVLAAVEKNATPAEVADELEDLALAIQSEADYIETEIVRAIHKTRGS
jgi:hypothetical protein